MPIQGTSMLLTTATCAEPSSSLYYTLISSSLRNRPRICKTNTAAPTAIRKTNFFRYFLRALKYGDLKHRVWSRIDQYPIKNRPMADIKTVFKRQQKTLRVVGFEAPAEPH